MAPSESAFKTTAVPHGSVGPVLHASCRAAATQDWAYQSRRSFLGSVTHSIEVVKTLEDVLRHFISPTTPQTAESAPRPVHVC